MDENFYPRPLRGGRPWHIYGSNKAGNISIHALCEEGDVVIRIIAAWSMLFLSTPSARRATTNISVYPDVKGISIHALCEEGDGFA